MKTNILILSNRLPVKMNISDDEVQVTPSEGGLATGLKSFHEKGKTLWFGWNGLFHDKISEELQSEITKRLKKNNCLSVPLTKQEIKDYYDGFSNKALWPLFHYFPEYAEFEMEEWTAYKEVNLKFAKAVLPHIKKETKIWIHDYQLLLVANFLRQSRPNLKIGFFNHIPFPSYEVFRLLPWREEVLIGLLGADLIGFHTEDYKAHFLKSVERILKLPVTENTVETSGRLVHVEAFPMGIDYEKFSNAAKENKAQLSETTKSFDFENEDQPRETKFILSVDRLDYTKGIANRIEAFAYFLEKYPKFKKKVRLIMLAVPSRTHVPQYQILKKEVDELVGRINGKFSDMDWTPIWYFFRSVPFDKLMSLYCNSQVAFINPLRDGMNLVAKEYIASRSNGTGVLVLSEMAGAAQELTEALIVNPYNFDQISDILKMALEMPKKEQIRRNQILQTHLKNHTVQQWAQGFLKELTKLDNKLHTCKEISPLLENEIANLFHSAKKSVVFLDYDGTLVEFKNDPQAVKPDPELLKILVQLTENQNTTIFLISGRDKETLEKWFSDIPINLIAEHGAWTRIENGKWKSSKKIDISWKDKILPVLKEFEQQFPGTFIEEKHFSIAWHYRNTKNTIPVKSLVNKIKESLQNKPLTILEGNKVLEITDNSISKGTAALENLKNKQYDFIFAMGDDTTDEFLFELLPENVISIKIGITETAAKYCLPDVAHARKLLKSFGEKKSDISFAKKKFKKSLS